MVREVRRARHGAALHADAAEAFTALEPILLKIGSEASLPERPSVLTPTPGATGADAKAAEARASDGEGERASPDPDVPRQPTGPGLKTWEGAPELAAEAVLSAPTSTPPPAPPQEAPTADQEPPVQATTTPAARGKERTIIAVAATFGVLLGLGIVANQRSRPIQVPRSAVPAATSSPAAPPAPKAAEPAPPAASSTTDEGTDEPAPAASASGASGAGTAAAVGGRRQKLCRPAGAKCFDNDDCCDRACHHWICRANAAMHDPYGAPGD